MSPETIRAVDIATFAQRQVDFLDVIGVIAQICPGLATSVFGKGVVDSSDIGRRVNISDIGAKVPKIIVIVQGRPIELLPSSNRVVERPSD